MQDETAYILEPTAFHSMREAQDLTDQFGGEPLKAQQCRRQHQAPGRRDVLRNGKQRLRTRHERHRRPLPRTSHAPPEGPCPRLCHHRQRARHTGHTRAEPQHKGGIRRAGPQARRPRAHLRHRQSHPGYWPLDHLPGMPEARQETPGPLWRRPAHRLRPRFGGILDRPRTPGHHRPVHHPHLTSGTVVKMVDFGYKPPSSIPQDTVSAAPPQQCKAAPPGTPNGSPFKPYCGPPHAEQPKPDWVCVSASPAGAALQAPVSAAPKSRPPGDKWRLSSPIPPHL